MAFKDLMKDLLGETGDIFTPGFQITGAMGEVGNPKTKLGKGVDKYTDFLRGAWRKAAKQAANVGIDIPLQIERSFGEERTKQIIQQGCIPPEVIPELDAQAVQILLGNGIAACGATGQRLRPKGKPSGPSISGSSVSGGPSFTGISNNSPMHSGVNRITTSGGDNPSGSYLDFVKNASMASRVTDIAVGVAGSTLGFVVKKKYQTFNPKMILFGVGCALIFNIGKYVIQKKTQTRI